MLDMEGGNVRGRIWEGEDSIFNPRRPSPFLPDIQGIVPH